MSTDTDIGEGVCHSLDQPSGEPVGRGSVFRIDPWSRSAPDTPGQSDARGPQLARHVKGAAQGTQTRHESPPSPLFVNPFRCRMWERHDRLEEYISEATCRDEIASIQEHGQLVPVLARKCSGSPGVDYELIYGARRLFVARHLGIPLLVDVRSVSDQEATVYIDIENRHRKDISPYERGRSFAQWLRAGLYANQRELARHLQISAAQVSRLLKLARLPSVIVSAFDTPMSICETWADDLWKVWDDPRTRDQVLARARLERRSAERRDAQTVFHLLTHVYGANSAGRPAKMRRGRDEIGLDSAGKPLFRIKFYRKSVAFVFPGGVISKDQVQSIKSLLSTVTLRSKQDG
jgi:ParB/RepB/Spo0J family partition protein